MQQFSRHNIVNPTLSTLMIKLLINFENSWYLLPFVIINHQYFEFYGLSNTKTLRTIFFLKFLISLNKRY